MARAGLKNSEKREKNTGKGQWRRAGWGGKARMSFRRPPEFAEQRRDCVLLLEHEFAVGERARAVLSDARVF